MNRLVLVPCLVVASLVVASYVALASYIVWPTLVYEHDGSRAQLDIPTSVTDRGIHKDRGSPTEQRRPVPSSPMEQMSRVLAYEVPIKPVAPIAKPAAALPDSHELTWVTVLLPAKVHTGPSVDSPITDFYMAGTTLH